MVGMWRNNVRWVEWELVCDMSPPRYNLSQLLIVPFHSDQPSSQVQTQHFLLHFVTGLIYLLLQPRDLPFDET